MSKTVEQDQSHLAKLVWATPDADKHLAYIARVSNPNNQANESIEGLLRYMEREGHVSPFTMVNFCVEVDTTRAIARQILRHWSLMPQEFSQRYQDASVLDGFVISEVRLQDNKNRQNSLEVEAESELSKWWREAQMKVIDTIGPLYAEALTRGVAKELARNLLPEGLTPSRLYFNGNLRSWIFYLRSRLHPSTQKEHRWVAIQIARIFKDVAPVTFNAFFSDFDFEAAENNVRS